MKRPQETVAQELERRIERSLPTHGHALIITIKNYGTFEIEIDPKMLRCLCMEAVRSGLAAKGALAVGFRNAS